jgi:hypothetical protein
MRQKSGTLLPHLKTSPSLFRQWVCTVLPVQWVMTENDALSIVGHPVIQRPMCSSSPAFWVFCVDYFVSKTHVIKMARFWSVSHGIKITEKNFDREIPWMSVNMKLQRRWIDRWGHFGWTNWILALYFSDRASWYQSISYNQLDAHMFYFVI